MSLLSFLFSSCIQIFEVQSQLQLPGLQEECKEFLRSTDIVDIRTFSKQQWKTFVGRKIAEQNKQEILTMMSRYKKITPDDYKSESCEVQPYIKALNIKDARLRFKLRAKMTPSLKMNFMSDPVYLKKIFGPVKVVLVASETHKAIYLSVKDILT